MDQLFNMRIQYYVTLLHLFPILFSPLGSSKSINSALVGNFTKCFHQHTISRQIIHTRRSHSFESLFSARVKNKRFLSPSSPRPLAIVTAKEVSHIQATILCAKYGNLQVRTRSGGHDYEGLSYTSQVPYVMLDMFNLRAIDIDIGNETAWIQSGATIGELYYSIGNASRFHAFPAGVCPTVGVGGHFSGGGFGNLMRKYGLAVDNIIDAHLIDVNGNLLDRVSMGDDLFWAIRGGGGASFGVVVSWKINLVRVPELVTVFIVNKYLDQGATDLVHRWQEVAPKLDNDLFLRIMPQVVQNAGSINSTVMVSFIGQFLGGADRLLSLMKIKFPELGLWGSDCYEVRWVDSAVFWGRFPVGTPVDVLLNRTNVPLFFKHKSDYVRNLIRKPDLETIWKMMLQVGNMWMQWSPYGGVMEQIPDTETPFPHRSGYLFKIEYAAQGNNEGTDIDRQVRLLRGMFESMARFVTMDPREAFLNYRDLDIGSNPSNRTDFDAASVYGMKYFKHNFYRLAEVKARVDPDDFFKNEQSIPPKFN